MESASGLGKWLFALVVLAACTILSGCLQPNTPPVITQLRADTDTATNISQVRPSTNCTISCLANDVDSGNLTYTWSATRGTLYGEGATVSWLAPTTEGTYSIAVNVTDDRGGEVGEALEIRVRKPG
jgi:hypothetical protein